MQTDSQRDVEADDIELKDFKPKVGRSSKEADTPVKELWHPMTL